MRRRYISTEISTDPRVARLIADHGEFAGLLYTWLVPHAEDDGTIPDDADKLRMLVVPGISRTAADVREALDAMICTGLLESSGERLAFPPHAFYRYQTYIPAAKRRTPKDETQRRGTPTNADERRETPRNASSPSPSPSPSPSLSNPPCSPPKGTPTPSSTTTREGETHAGSVTAGDGTPAGETSTQPAPDPCPHAEIIAAYHELLPTLPRVMEWGEASRRHLRARWRESKMRQSVEWWRDLFRQVAGSPFLTGAVPSKDGRPPFHADLAWIVNPTNLEKVINGRYSVTESRHPVPVIWDGESS